MCSYCIGVFEVELTVKDTNGLIGTCTSTVTLADQDNFCDGWPTTWVYVDKDATGLNDGTSWMDAFNDLQDALDVARLYSNVDQIWIAHGEYYPTPGTNQSVSFEMVSGVN